MKNINYKSKNGLNMGQQHGYWGWYYNSGELLYRGCYDNGKQVGYWEWFSPINYKVDDKTFYIK